MLVPGGLMPEAASRDKTRQKGDKTRSQTSTDARGGCGAHPDCGGDATLAENNSPLAEN